jgi:hypothetical protein
MATPKAIIAAAVEWVKGLKFCSAFAAVSLVSGAEAHHNQQEDQQDCSGDEQIMRIVHAVIGTRFHRSARSAHRDRGLLSVGSAFRIPGRYRQRTVPDSGDRRADGRGQRDHPQLVKTE